LAFLYSFADVVAATMPPRERKAISSVAKLTDAVYHNLNWLRERVILAAKNGDVHEIMKQILAMLPGVVTEYKIFLCNLYTVLTLLNACK
jgi:hypothetical protein